MFQLMLYYRKYLSVHKSDKTKGNEDEGDLINISKNYCDKTIIILFTEVKRTVYDLYNDLVEYRFFVEKE